MKSRRRTFDSFRGLLAAYRYTGFIGMLRLPVDRELGAEERAREFGNDLLRGVGGGAEPPCVSRSVGLSSHPQQDHVHAAVRAVRGGVARARCGPPTAADHGFTYGAVPFSTSAVVQEAPRRTGLLTCSPPIAVLSNLLVLPPTARHHGCGRPGREA